MQPLLAICLAAGAVGKLADFPASWPAAGRPAGWPAICGKGGGGDRDAFRPLTGSLLLRYPRPTFLIELADRGVRKERWHLIRDPMPYVTDKQTYRLNDFVTS